MKRLLIGCAAILAAGAAAGQVLECVDAKGKKEYAQTCPPGTVKETKLMKSSPGGTPGAAGSGAAAKSLAEREAGFRKRAMERQEADTKAEKEKAEAKIAERNCTDARAQLKQLQDGQRIARIDPNTGERSYLTDAERPAEIANARKAIASWCKQ
ncbi:MAG: DUF4124 domain-containing protein [Betaproteobacteria bacterium]|nr:DUF4124 domain-containing protein [Betaproteobacteria bacterium]MBI3056752.1 DUF4124 domain-containing protein [Betaproteobacteria bacterium]